MGLFTFFFGDLTREGLLNKYTELKKRYNSGDYISNKEIHSLVYKVEPSRELYGYEKQEIYATLREMCDSLGYGW